MSASKAFPLVLRWLLLAPLALFVVSFGLPKEAIIGGFIVACVAECLFVPVAIFYLARGGYSTPGNVLITVAAAVPAGILVAAVFILKFGHFHI